MIQAKVRICLTTTKILLGRSLWYKSRSIQHIIPSCHLCLGWSSWYEPKCDYVKEDKFHSLVDHGEPKLRRIYFPFHRRWEWRKGKAWGKTNMKHTRTLYDYLHKIIKCICAYKKCTLHLFELHKTRQCKLCVYLQSRAWKCINWMLAKLCLKPLVGYTAYIHAMPRQ